MAGQQTGMGRGKTYPASAARHLLNPLRRLVQPPSRVVRRMSVAPDDRVLELGCGPGWFSPALATAVPRGSLTLCDVQPGMLAVAAERTSQFAHVECVTADAGDLPFADASFDAVLLATVIGETADPMGCMLEVARVLAPSGVMTVCETRRDSDFTRFADLIELAGAVGLQPAGRHGPPWEYTARFITL
ncbi:MAG: class I SAM-dependent methyltransferase [Acidimicrobiales bacterium]